MVLQRVPVVKSLVEYPKNSRIIPDVQIQLREAEKFCQYRSHIEFVADFLMFLRR